MSGEAKVSLSRLESRFLGRIREISRPLPITNRPAGGHRVDCRWPDHCLTVELDGFRFHNSRHSWKQDHRREREPTPAETSFAATPTATFSSTPRRW